jgi:hypothetical protein
MNFLKEKMDINIFEFDSEGFKNFLENNLTDTIVSSINIPEQLKLVGEKLFGIKNTTILEKDAALIDEINNKDINFVLKELIRVSQEDINNLTSYKNNSSKLFLLFQELENISTFHIPQSKFISGSVSNIIIQPTRYFDIISDSFKNELSKKPTTKISIDSQLPQISVGLESAVNNLLENSFNNLFTTPQALYSDINEYFGTIASSAIQGVSNFYIGTAASENDLSTERKAILKKYSNFIEAINNLFIKNNNINNEQIVYIVVSSIIKIFNKNRNLFYDIYSNKFNINNNILDLFYKKNGNNLIVKHDFEISDGQQEKMFLEEFIKENIGIETFQSSIQNINNDIFNLSSLNEEFANTLFSNAGIDNETIRKIFYFIYSPHSKVNELIFDFDSDIKNIVIPTNYMQATIKFISDFLLSTSAGNNFSLIQYTLFIILNSKNNINNTRYSETGVKTTPLTKIQLVNRLFKLADDAEDDAWIGEDFQYLKKRADKYKNNDLTIVELYKQLKDKLNLTKEDILEFVIEVATVAGVGTAFGAIGAIAGSVALGGALGGAFGIGTLVTSLTFALGSVLGPVLGFAALFIGLKDLIGLDEKEKLALILALGEIENSGLHPDFEVIDNPLLEQQFNSPEERENFINLFYDSDNPLTSNITRIFNRYNIISIDISDQNKAYLEFILCYNIIIRVINQIRLGESLLQDVDFKKENKTVKKISYFLFQYLNNNFNNMIRLKNFIDLSVNDIQTIVNQNLSDIDLLNEQDILNLNSFYDETVNNYFSYSQNDPIQFLDHNKRDIEFIEVFSKSSNIDLQKNNKKILTVGLKRYFKKDVLEKNDLINNKIKIKIFKTDISRPQIIFKPQVFEFDLDLYLNIGNNNRRINFFNYNFVYNDQNPEQNLINKKFITNINENVRKNHTMSLYLEKYLNLFMSINTNNINFSSNDPEFTGTDIDNISNGVSFSPPVNVVLNEEQQQQFDLTANFIDTTFNSFSSDDKIQEKLFFPKKFDRIFNILFDVSDFIVDQQETDNLVTAENSKYLTSLKNNSLMTEFVVDFSKNINKQLTDRYFVQIESS